MSRPSEQLERLGRHARRHGTVPRRRRQRRRVLRRRRQLGDGGEALKRRIGSRRARERAFAEGYEGTRVCRGARRTRRRRRHRARRRRRHRARRRRRHRVRRVDVGVDVPDRGFDSKRVVVVVVRRGRRGAFFLRRLARHVGGVRLRRAVFRLGAIRRLLGVSLRFCLRRRANRRRVGALLFRARARHGGYGDGVERAAGSRRFVVAAVILVRGIVRGETRARVLGRVLDDPYARRGDVRAHARG